jgi:hypothetical protein
MSLVKILFDAFWSRKDNTRPASCQANYTDSFTCFQYVITTLWDVLAHATSNVICF